jgi:dienelactone hydrolase
VLRSRFLITLILVMTGGAAGPGDPINTETTPATTPSTPPSQTFPAPPPATTFADAKAQSEQVTKPEVESTFIPIKARGLLGSTKEIRLAATIYRPNQSGTFPVVIFNHGSTGMGAIPTTRSFTYEAQAEYFLERGYAVVVPMRKGRGKSEGTYAESEERRCDFSTWSPGIESAMEDVDGVLEYLSTQPYADVSNILLAGISRGGFLAVTYAAKGKYRSDVRGVINFVGGWVGEARSCRDDFNRWSYSQLGQLTKLTMLWLYAEGDAYYSSNAIKGYVQAFADGGGVADFHLFSTVPGNGHHLANYREIWKAAADQYLSSLVMGKSQE